jgi:hypothetical protein
MKTISLVIIALAMATIFGGVTLCNLGMLPKLGAYVMAANGYILILIHMAMQKRIESEEMQSRNRELYK